ncbi:MAG: hypothetical protein H6811_01945 [Phycisphaeraceae bacterium]|nr:hypothetical protein [Phycisphaeraceae bacterium]
MSPHHEPAIASEDLLLLDGVADLNGVGELVGVAVGEFGRGEGGPVDAIPAGASAERDNEIAGVGRAVHTIPRHHADAAAEDQRIAHVAIVELDRAVDGGDAHAVAIVAHARNDVGEDATGMEAAGRKRWRFGRNG